MSVRRLVVLFAVLCLAVIAVPGGALAGPDGAPVQGTFEGSGSSTVDFVAGRPILRWESEGTLKGTLFGPATYRYSIGSTGIVTFESFEVRANGGSAYFSAGPLFGSAPAAFTLTSGTGRFAHASGELTLRLYAKSDLECLDYPPAPDIFCNWNETGGISATVKMH